jgi:hypothetical protein
MPYGTVFKLDITGKETVLYGFTGGRDGSFPSGNVVRNRKGNIYGSTYEGGSAFGLILCIPAFAASPLDTRAQST